MKPDLQRRVQRYGWDKAAPFYETGWQEQLWPAQESLLSEADPQPGEKVLDISCGTGLVTMPVGEIVQPGGEVTGVDISEGMIEKARSEKEKKEMGEVCQEYLESIEQYHDGMSYHVSAEFLTVKGIKRKNKPM